MIDSLLASQRAATSQISGGEPVAILLDITKAFDSIGRAFLLAALRWSGLPDIFVSMVDFVHEHTSRFMINKISFDRSRQ